MVLVLSLWENNVCIMFQSELDCTWIALKTDRHKYNITLIRRTTHTLNMHIFNTDLFSLSWCACGGNCIIAYDTEKVCQIAILIDTGLSEKKVYNGLFFDSLLIGNVVQCYEIEWEWDWRDRVGTVMVSVWDLCVWWTVDSHLIFHETSMKELKKQGLIFLEQHIAMQVSFVPWPLRPLLQGFFHLNLFRGPKISVEARTEADAWCSLSSKL